MKKRIMAMLLALCMVLSICVPIAVADDEQPEEKAVVPECSCWGASLGLPLRKHSPLFGICDRQNFCKEEINTTVSHMVYNWADYPDDVKTYLVELLTGDEAYAEKYAELQKELKLEDNRPQITVEDKSPTVGGYKPSVSVEGQTVRMDKYAKATLSAGDDTAWQICIDTTSEIWQWADITGGQGSLTVSYGLIGSLLTEKNGEYHAYLRAYRTYEDGEAQLCAYSKIYTIVMDLSEPDLSEGQSLPTPDFEEMTPSDAAPASTEEPAPAATETDSAAAGANAVTPASLSETGAETGDVVEPSVTTAEPTFIQPVPAFPQADGDAPTTYVILINYQFADGTQAAPSWSATVAAGSTYTQDIQSPAIVGYAPDQVTVHVDASEATTYTVTYYPAEVEFTVKHYQQNVANDEYTLVDTETKNGYTESAVGGALAKTYEGFYALLYDTTTEIAADGSTVVEIYYDRSYYLMSFDLVGGYGVEPIYARFGTPISVDTPTKPGYTFESWTPSIPATMPADNTSYKASWKIGESGFTVVFWYENANDNGYSVAGTYKPADVAPGTEKKSEDYKNQNFTGRDTKHFTYNAAKAETVTVKGDGSTVLNVYYTRNTYTLTFLGAGTTLICAKVEHTHSSDTCCDKSHWLSCNGYGFWGRCNADNCPVGYEHTHSNDCYGLTITAKYQADIHGNFPIKDGNDTIWWNVPDGCESFKPGTMLGSIDTMPGENITFKKAGTQSGAILYYYIETLNGETGTYTQGGKSFKLYKQITLEKECRLTYSEEFHNITGFTQWWSDPKFDKMEQGGVAYAGGNGWSGYYIKDENYLCYTRNSYNLKFYNYNAEVPGKGGSVQYEAPLSGYQFTPEYPKDLEKNAYRFAGWYTTAECFDGTEVNWETAKMPAADVTLYAKWVPNTHTVKTYLTKEAMEAGAGSLTAIDNIPHGAKVGDVASVPADPKNGSYTFVGWFYIDETGEEKAFSFELPVNRDLNLYAKWSSNTMMTYTVKYELEDGTEIAPPTTGSALAGSTKTFNAKTGDALNEGYQSGYFPETSSHSITVNIEDPSQNTYTFVYVPKAEVAYRVQYLEKGTGNELAEPKTVTTSDAVVTETFKQISGYAPDAYQKQLVLSADEDQNIITFWYVKDAVHAPVQIIHWVQNIAGDGYAEYQSSTNLNGVIGTEYSEEPLTIAGFRYNVEKSNAKGALTAEGLVLNLYYDRIEYPYEFRFVEKDSDPEKQLADSVTGSARYQAQVTQTAKTIPGYTLVSTENQAIHIAIEDGTTAVKNVKIFYYTEQTVDIKYKVVGPDGCGTLDNYQDVQLKVTTGEVKGSAPTAAEGFKFVGWYKDEDCTQPVDADWVEDNKLTPQKTKDYGGVMGYEAKTYYAKFAYDVFDLTVSKSGADAVDENQTFIFLISGEGVEMEVVVHGNSRVTVKGLKVGTYTVTELTDWSWRYKPHEAQKTVLQTDAQQAAANQTAHTVEFVNERKNSKWLNGAAFCDNRWITKTAINSATVEIN